MVNLRRLGRAGSEDSCLGPEGMSRSLEGDLGSRPSNVPLCHSWDTDREEALALGMSRQWLKGGIWPDLVGPFLALPVLPGY